MKREKLFRIFAKLGKGRHIIWLNDVPIFANPKHLSRYDHTGVLSALIQSYARGVYTLNATPPNQQQQHGNYQLDIYLCGLLEGSGIFIIKGGDTCRGM
jgi:hypothetical protein